MFMEKPGDCSPSRSVVSKMMTRLGSSLPKLGWSMAPTGADAVVEDAVVEDAVGEDGVVEDMGEGFSSLALAEDIALGVGSQRG